MKGSGKKEHSGYEKAWQEAFHDAELAPQERVWSSIEGRLASAENKKYKRKAILYKWVAAASLLIGLGLSYYAFDRLNSGDSSGNIVESSQGVETKKGGKDNADNSSSEATDAGKILSEDENERLNNSTTGQGQAPVEPEAITGNPSVAGNRPANEEKTGTNPQSAKKKAGPVTRSNDKSLSMGLVTDTQAKLEQVGQNEDDNNHVPSYTTLISNTFINYNIRPKGYDLYFRNKLYELDAMYKVPGIIPLVKANQNASRANLFAALNFSSGLFDPKFNNGNTSLAQNSFDSGTGSFEDFSDVVSENEETDPGFSYTLGVNIGMKLSKRWILQSGFQYANYRSNSSTSAFLENQKNNERVPLFFTANSNTVENLNESKLGFTQNVALQNNFEFASIPIKAGYIVLDRKIGILVSAGIGTDFFLQNNLETENRVYSDIKVTPGADSPFRRVYFNGLMGAEISYRFGRNYTITLEPHYRLSINSLTKPGSDFTSNPQTLSLSLGLKYFFNK